MTDYSYIGVGKLHLRVAGSATALAFVGNCSALNFAVTEDSKELKDFTQAGGGTYNEVKRVSSVEVQMTLHDLSPTNLARAIYGDANAIAAGAATAENIGAVYAGGLSVTDYPIDTTVAPTDVKHAQFGATARANTTAYTLGQYYTASSKVFKCTVAGTTAGSAPAFPSVIGDTVVDGTATFRYVAGTAALTADTHYTVSAGGLTFASTGVGIYDGEEVVVSYTKDAGYSIEALLNASQEYELFFDGLNEARSGAPFTVHAFRVKLGATNGLSLIGEDYYAGEQSGKVLKDTTKNGTTVSQYFMAQIVS